MKPRIFALMAIGFLGATAAAAEFRVESFKQAPPTDKLAPEIASQLSENGLRVFQGDEAYCDLWFAKQWDVKDGFEPTAEVLYPFKPGQLVGAARFAEDGADFRDQEIEDGVYTLRYAQQPVDGSHIGTSPTRDFFLLLRAEDDQSAEPLGYEDLTLLSSEAVGSTHPGMLCLQPVVADEDKFPSMRVYDAFDWWIVGFHGNAKVGEKTKKLPVELVISGQAIE